MAAGHQDAGRDARGGIHTGRLQFSTKGDGDIVDLTEGILEVVRTSRVSDGAVTVFAVGSTAAVTTMEYERGGVHDLRAKLDELVPKQDDYEHNRLNHDTNSHAHIKAAIVGPSETIPLSGGQLATGTWQQMVLIDFDDRPRDRTVVVQVFS
jgi:secondary thiamine-phosphate synthase enzyme